MVKVPCCTATATHIMARSIPDSLWEAHSAKSWLSAVAWLCHLHLLSLWLLRWSWATSADNASLSPDVAAAQHAFDFAIGAWRFILRRSLAMSGSWPRAVTRARVEAYRPPCCGSCLRLDPRVTTGPDDAPTSSLSRHLGRL